MVSHASWSVQKFPGYIRKAICSSHAALKQLLHTTQEGLGKPVNILSILQKAKQNEPNKTNYSNDVYKKVLI